MSRTSEGSNPVEAALRAWDESDPATLPFNKTPDPVFLGPIEVLRDRFAANVSLAAERDAHRRSLGIGAAGMPLITAVLAARLEAISSMTAEDLRHAYRFQHVFSQIAPDDGRLMPFEKSLMLQRRIISDRAILNRWLKFVFVNMWKDGVALLPLGFMLNSSFSDDELRDMLPEFASCQLDQRVKGGRSFGLRLSLASKWRTFSDVDLDVVGPYSHWVCKDDVRRHALGVRSQYPYTPFTSTLKQWFAVGAGRGLRYEAKALGEYLEWMHSLRAGTADVFPSDSHSTKAMIVENRRRKVIAARGRYKRAQDGVRVEALPDGDVAELKRRVADGQTYRQVALGIVAERAQDPEEVLEYFRRLRGRRATAEDDQYPGRGHALDEASWTKWSAVFDKYHVHLSDIGYEETGNWFVFQRVLRDYVTCYLPWWAELNVGVEIRTLSCPSLFRRFGDWVEGGDDLAPVPLLRFYDAVRGGGAAENLNLFIRGAHKFFEYVRAYSLPLGVLNVDFVNPVTKSMDRRHESRPSKTNKAPIPKYLIPYLLRYAYAVEGFFQSLSDRFVQNGASTEERRMVGAARANDLGQARFDPSRWGLDVVVEMGGTALPIRDVPSVAFWSDLSMRRPDGSTGPCFVPVLSGLRLVICALETGLRFQGLQWLCRRTFATLARGVDDSLELVPLVVNTDKSKDGAWRTVVVRRAFDVLLREEDFQASLADGHVERLVVYENRSRSRFDPIVPLFRSPSSDFPVHDGAYQNVWERLLVGFCGWAQEVIPEADVRPMWRFVPEVDGITGKPREVLLVDGEGSCRCSPVKMRFTHTPHSARSSFISARSGVLPLDVTAWLVGHRNTATTAHYTVEDDEEVGRKVLAASNALWQPVSGDPVHIRADKVDSALRTSFAADRGGTARAFGFQTLALLNDDSACTDGVERLRTTAMASVVFRETHVCPVGEECPTDVLDAIVEPRRCGLCPLAVRCVDHLPSIGAKARQLLERIEEAGRLVARMKARGEPSATVEEVQSRRRLDVLEYEGWRTASEMLARTLRDLEGEPEATFLVGKPDAVRLHLRMVTRDCDVSSFLMHRLVDAATHSAFETEALRAKASQLRQRLLTSAGAAAREAASYDVDPIAGLLSSLRVVLRARGLDGGFAAALRLLREAAADGDAVALPAIQEG